MTVRQSPKEQNRRPDNTGRQYPAIPPLAVAIQEGRAFSISDRVTDLGNADSFFLFIDNSDEKDLDVYLFIEATGVADFDVSFGASENTPGQDANINNASSGSGRSETFEARITETGETGDYTHGSAVPVTNIVPGGESTGVMGSKFGAPTVTVDPGGNKLFQLQNRSGGSGRFAYDCVVAEKDP